jgi:hypothetical protein
VPWRSCWTCDGPSSSHDRRVSLASALDLSTVVLVALVWMTREARRIGVGRVWVYWALTLLFGVGGTLPLFLYARERRLRPSDDAS